MSDSSQIPSQREVVSVAARAVTNWVALNYKALTWFAEFGAPNENDGAQGPGGTEPGTKNFIAEHPVSPGSTVSVSEAKIQGGGGGFGGGGQPVADAYSQDLPNAKTTWTYVGHGPTSIEAGEEHTVPNNESGDKVKVIITVRPEAAVSELVQVTVTEDGIEHPIIINGA